MRQPGHGRAISTVRLRGLERAGLIGFGRVHGRLAVVLTPAGEHLVAERRERKHARRRNGADQPARWWQA